MITRHNLEYTCVDQKPLGKEWGLTDTSSGSYFKNVCYPAHPKYSWMKEHSYIYCVFRSQ